MQKKKKTLYLLPAELCAADQREMGEDAHKELARVDHMGVTDKCICTVCVFGKDKEGRRYL